jgi:Tfp pilus assembly protein PilN
LIEINLLPGGAARRPAASGRGLKLPAMPSMGGDPRVSGLAGVGLLAALVCGYLFWTTSTQHDELQAQIDQGVRDSTNLASTIKLVHELEARQDTIREKIGIIRSVDQRRYVWPHILDEVSHSLPPYTWLTKIASEEPPAAAAPAKPAPGADAKKGPAPGGAPPAPAGPMISIEGNTATTQALTRFMKNLEASPMIRDVALVTSSQSTEAGHVVLKFSLEARYESPDTAVIQTVPLFVAR